MLRLSALAFALLLPLAALAQTTRYTFESGPYTAARAPYTTDMGITGSITTTSPIPPNASGLQIGPRSAEPLVSAYTFFDGLATYTESNSVEFGPNPALFRVWTDGNGDIINWYIFLYTPQDASDGEPIFALSLFDGESSANNGDCSNTPCDSSTLTVDVTPFGSRQPGGTWTTQRPEPVPTLSQGATVASILLLMLGALATTRLAARRA